MNSIRQHPQRAISLAVVLAILCTTVAIPSAQAERLVIETVDGQKIVLHDPDNPRPPPRRPTAEEIETAKREALLRDTRALELAQQAWPERQAEVTRYVRQSFAAGPDAADPDHVRHDNIQWRTRLTARRDQAIANRARVEAELDAIARKYGIDRHRSGRGTLVGDTPHGPIFMTPQSAIAANSIFADDLWPAGLYGWQNTSLSRNLTGQGVRVSIWEANELFGTNFAGILTNHGEFSGGRAVQVDSAASSNHATAVASVIVGGGNLDVFQGGFNQGKLLRGIAYQGEVRGHDLAAFADEMNDAVLDGQSFSNHSYGVAGGWGKMVHGGQEWWVWSLPAFSEDPRFGAYSAAATGNASSADIDDFVVDAEVQLPVYAAGNSTDYGPNFGPEDDVTHRIPDGMGGTTTSTATRDWFNGDDGYDTVLSPGTAKNILTVGSITDIDFFTGTFGISSFTGTGPTDDGRIKPDLVAVGQRNTTFGFGASLFAAHKTTTGSYYNGIVADGMGTVNLSGTSFAAPMVVGSLMLAEQRRLQ